MHSHLVGFYRPASGVDFGEMRNPRAGWQELIDYRNGK